MTSDTSLSSLPPSLPIPSLAHFRLYQLRWLALAFLFVQNVGTGISTGYFASVTNLLAQHYQVEGFMINLFSIINFAFFIPASAVASYVLDKAGLRASCITGSFTGQIFASLSQPFLMNATTKLAAIWFGEKERTLANTLASIGNPIGIAAIVGLAPTIMNSNPANTPTLNMVLFIVCAILASTSLLMRNAPPTPPAPSAESKSESFLPGLIDTVTNLQFWVLMAVFGLIVGMFNTMVTYISDLATPYGFSNDESGTIGVLSIVAGLVTAGVVGIILDCTKGHKLAIKCHSFVAAVGMVLFTLALKYQSAGLVYTGAILVGGGGFPLIPIILELGVECTYPVDEGTSSGLLWTISNLTGVLFVIGADKLRAPDGKMFNSAIMLTVIGGLAAICTWFYTARSRRVFLDQTVEKEEEIPVIESTM